MEGHECGFFAGPQQATIRVPRHDVSAGNPPGKRERTMSQSIMDQVISLVAEKAMLDRDQVTPTSTMEDLGIDSLTVVELIFAIEETFGIEVPFNANEPENSEFDVSSVGAVAESVERIVAEGAGA